MTLTVDQPMQAATLNSAMMMPPIQPKEKRVIVIWRRPNLGPRVEKKATGKTPIALKIIITARPSQKPSPNARLAIAPRAIVEITRLADSHIVKLSRMRTCERVLGETRSIPCVSKPCSSGMAIISVAIRCSPEKKTIEYSVKPPLFDTCRSNHISSEMPGSQKFSTLLKNYVEQSFSSGVRQ